MPWRVSFYNERVEQETLELPPGILANFLRIAELIEAFGPELGRPHTAPLGKGLFEIRAKGREGIARSIFCHLPESEIVVLATFIKKQSAIPRRQINLARQRMKEVQTNG